jgi:nitrate reductase cytochrome c-type subunit
MRKVLNLCLKCNNKCKLETETGAKLISCKLYCSKRSINVQKEKGKGNVSPTHYPSV